MPTRCCLLILISIAGLVSVSAQQPDTLASIKGTVVNSITGEPLSKAIVTIYNQVDGNKSYSAATSPTGVFELRSIDPGPYAVFASRQGFIEGGRKGAANRGGQSGKIVTLGVGEALASVKLVLAPQGIIAGRVTDYDGEPLQNVQVQALRRNWGQGPSLMHVQSAMTNDLGEYRLTGLAPGRYIISALPQNNQPHVASKDSPEPVYPQLYSPGVTDLSQAQPIDVTAGALRQGVDFRVFKLAARRVRGKVVLEEGVSMQGFSLMLTTQEGVDGRSRGGSGFKKDGTFDFDDVLPGRYFLACFSQTLHCRTPIEVVDKNLDDIVVRPRPGLTVIGHIRWDGEAPPPGSDPRVNEVNVGMNSPSGFGANMDQGKDGLTFRNVPPGTMKVQVYAMGDAYLKAIRYGGQEVENDTIEIAEGAELEVVMRPGPGSLEGTVELGDAAVPDAFVLLVPVMNKSRQWLFEQATTDQNGHFKIERITPGEYDAYAFESVENGAWFDPEFSTKWSRRAERIKIQEKSRESKKLALIKASNQ